MKLGYLDIERLYKSKSIKVGFSITIVKTR